MKQLKPQGASPAVCITYKNGKKHVSFNITNTRLEDWVDKQEIQNALHISNRTLHTLRKTRRIPYSTIGGKIYYYLPGILALLEQNIPGSAAPIR